MINIANLINKSSVFSNYFAPDIYAKGDFESGLIENRQGRRLLALPETLLIALHRSLNSEVGSAAEIVLYNCGVKWGENFYRRFEAEVSSYYGRSISEMAMVELLSCLKQCWKAHGWGKIRVNYDNYDREFIVVEIEHSAFAGAITSAKQPSCFMEAGLLSAFFSELLATNLHCLQTTCESLGAKSNLFVLGLAQRLKPAEVAIATGKNHAEIMQYLCTN